ncbi:SDR family NAD(P)-dependent oxidoreductase [Paenibacillus dendritiformis]|uniref:SDR family NAD(P)-dependent oxidoreductase n=1 Tax=Paenibacillus dendritiformis TaxID=130049 RepID=UPI00143CC685|nr:SDR family NAD(P)-dependent oxidoreductase [Paenibacillus dendritiformis]NKI20927.1 SDR family NAD(P)-dependent oxidoreductase [Paenibacillus dendritiformis]NRF97836.1 SDR family NAD(P)-dependent oxidoreductase [Paenibacillus dendritiformis]
MHNFFNGKKILIIGGTGTIGRGLLDRLLAYSPAVIRVFSRDEYKQFKVQQQYREYSNIRYLIGDVRDYPRVVRAMEDIDYVFHAAAMKHVPACEYNPFEAVQTNIIGTQHVIQAALEMGVSKVIFTSTDKAIAPANTYGASKLMAERLISAAQYQAGAKETIFAAVRFGNIMGSRGSVIPLFIKQISENRKITLTSSDMSRFMMTLDEATSLMLRAMELAQGGEVFVLKMPVINILDLAEVLIREVSTTLGFPQSDVIVEEIGIRTGEKMYEELMSQEEADVALEIPDMFIIPSPYKKKYNYPNALKAQKSSYSSYATPPISKNEIREILQRNKLLISKA